MSFETIQYRVADTGVAFISIDVPGLDVNVLTPELHREVGEIATQLAGDDSASGAVLHSGKQGFMAGGDLKRIVGYYDMDRTAADAYEQSRAFSRSLRQLETCGKPVAVPGAGGTQRLPRLIGLKEATSLILDGTTMSPARAFELGIVDELAAPDELLGTAERWVIEHGRSNQPWDRRGFRIPGGSKLNDMNVGRLFQIQTAKVGAKYRHNYPAPIAALRALFNGTTVNSIDPGLRIETREFSALTRDPVARNIIRTLFINKRERKFRKADADSALLELCEQAYADEAQRMLDQGVTGAVVRNAAWAAGMKDHPTGLETAESESLPEQGSFDFAQLKQRLLAIQSLAAAELWAIEGLDPVIADLSTVLGGGFPSYTGGVMSHISTMGLPEFIALCDKFADEFGDHFRPSDSLRARSAAKQSIYQDR